MGTVRGVDWGKQGVKWVKRGRGGGNGVEGAW